MFKLSFPRLLALLAGLVAIVAVVAFLLIRRDEAAVRVADRPDVAGDSPQSETPLLDLVCAQKQLAQTKSTCTRDPDACTADVDHALHAGGKPQLKDGQRVLRIYQDRYKEGVTKNEVRWKVVVGSDTDAGLSTYDFDVCARRLSNRQAY